MNNVFYSVFFIFLGIVALFTGEVITFVMLGFILVALQNINHTLKKLVHKEQESEEYYEYREDEST